MINPFSPILFCSLSSTGSVKRYFVIMAHGIFCFCCFFIVTGWSYLEKNARSCYLNSSQALCNLTWGGFCFTVLASKLTVSGLFIIQARADARNVSFIISSRWKFEPHQLFWYKILLFHFPSDAATQFLEKLTFHSNYPSVLADLAFRWKRGWSGLKQGFRYRCCRYSYITHYMFPYCL